MRTNYIVTYDIRDEKRLRRVFRICKDFGIHLQFSVFECDLTAAEKVRMETRLREVINWDEDQVLFIDLGHTTHRSERTITSLGQSYSKLFQPCFVA